MVKQINYKYNYLVINLIAIILEKEVIIHSTILKLLFDLFFCVI